MSRYALYGYTNNLIELRSCVLHRGEGFRVDGVLEANSGEPFSCVGFVDSMNYAGGGGWTPVVGCGGAHNAISGYRRALGIESAASAVLVKPPQGFEEHRIHSRNLPLPDLDELDAE